MRRLTTRVLSLTAMSVLVLAACGGDDDDEATQQEIEDAVDEGDAPDDTTAEEPVGDDEGDDEGSGTGEDSAACEVMTQEDAEALFGVDAQPEEDAVDIGLGSSCLWENVGADDIGTPSQLLQLQLNEGEQFYAEEVYADAEQINDIGDRAFLVSGEGSLGGPTIGFQVGDTVGLISYSVVNVGVEDADKIDAAAREEQFVELARTVADRL